MDKVGSFKFACPSCKASIRAPLAAVGKTIACPGCKGHFVVPKQAPILMSTPAKSGPALAPPATLTPNEQAFTASAPLPDFLLPIPPPPPTLGPFAEATAEPSIVPPRRRKSSGGAAAVIWIALGAVATALLVLTFAALFRPTEMPQVVVTPVPAKEAVAKAQPQTKPAPVVAGVGSAIRIAEAEVELMSVRKGIVNLEGGFRGPSMSRDIFLNFALKITNRSSTKLLPFAGWGSAELVPSGDDPRLADNFGNAYRRQGFQYGMLRPTGQTLFADIYPGKSVTDLIVFNLPVENMTHVDLDLPASKVGGLGMLRFRIKAEEIEK